MPVHYFKDYDNILRRRAISTFKQAAEEYINVHPDCGIIGNTDKTVQFVCIINPDDYELFIEAPKFNTTLMQHHIYAKRDNLAVQYLVEKRYLRDQYGFESVNMQDTITGRRWIKEILNPREFVCIACPIQCQHLHNWEGS